MEVTMDMVERIAHLARLRFDDSEMAEIREDLEKMISFVDRLKGRDLEGLEPLTQTAEGGNAWRTDEAAPAPATEEALREAPARKGPYFTVPKVIQKD
jgi:aspartyl-tRNA(Asn)/glutamyl-tRNA(Gln) amidotransferase subunit C